VLVLTWLHRARRDVLRVHPRGDPARPLTGVFSTRSPDRPNPLGLHRVTILAIDGTRVLVGSLEALDGTPVVDVKPVLGMSRSGSRAPGQDRVPTAAPPSPLRAKLCVKRQRGA
jgi:tRNA-Thr(GGU) m(6)t(6)A37 methyltransferase TsaA